MEVEELLQKLQETQRELQEKSQQLELINQIGSLLISDLDLEKVVQNVTDIATKVSKAQFGALFYANELGQEDFQLYALSGAPKEHFAHLPSLRLTPLLAPTLKDKQIIRSDDITQDPRYGLKKPHHGIPKGHLPIRSYMALPVISKSGLVLGALFFGHAQAGVFTQQEENMVLSIAAQAAVAIDSAHLHGAKLQAEQQKSLRQISAVLESITDGFFALNRDWQITYWNKRAEQVSKIKRDVILGQSLWQVFDKFQLKELETALQAAMMHRRPLSFRKFFSPLNLWLDVNTFPSEEGISVYLRDVTKQHRIEQIERLEKKVLEMSTRPGNTLEEMVTYYLMGIEKIDPRLRLAVCKAEGEYLVHLAAPSMPAAYLSIFNGFRIGPHQGSCGAAAFTKEKVISRNIAEDTKWYRYLSLANAADIKACWAVPLIGANQKLLGTFAIYPGVEGAPTPEEDALMDRIAGLLQMIIENKVTEVALLESNERYNLATAATNDAIWDFDLLTGKIYQGPGYARLFGYQDEEQGSTFDLFSERIHPDDTDRVRATFLQALEQEDVQHCEIEYRFLKSNGEYACVINHAHIVRNHEGAAVRAVGAIHDITERKQFEAERELLIEELKQNNSDLRQFSYITSHKLRAPLSNLMMITQMLRPDTIENADSRLLVEKFKESTAKLNDTLHDLLNILVIKNDTGLKKEEVRLDESWQQVRQACTQQLTECGATLSVDFSGAEHVWAEPGYLHSIFFNLLTNAIKFRSPDRPLHIALQSSLNGACVELQFTDNGLGIDLARYQDRIFGLYQRFHHHDNSKGLGLYVTQSQIKAMGGTISVQSEVNKGTTFHIQFKQR